MVNEEKSIAGLFASLSYDEGEASPVREMIAPADGKTYYAFEKNNLYVTLHF